MKKLLNEPIRVAILGGGGREHAIAEKVSESPVCAGVLVVPGNDGMSLASSKVKTHRLALGAWEDSGPALVEVLREKQIDFVVVSTDDLLASGYVDQLEKEGFKVFGPRKMSAKLEWSKAFAKTIMGEAKVPTARYVLLDESNWEKDWASAAEKLGGFPAVLKYDGLALGKGVAVCQQSADAEAFLKEVFQSKKFSKSDKPKVILEECLIGHEVSVFALTDGNHFAVLEPVCDHKRLKEGNQGPNTGGMGAYSPVPWLTKSQLDRIAAAVFPPVLEAMRNHRANFKGLLYAGLIVKRDEFWVLEFNARFGDPEAQALLPRLESDLLPLLYGVATGELERYLDVAPLRWRPQGCVNVVVASRGYPEAPETGMAIELPDLQTSTCKFFFSGVKGNKSGLVTSGGRVLSVSALAESLDEASRVASLGADSVKFEGKQYRGDIAKLRADS